MCPTGTGWYILPAAEKLLSSYAAAIATMQRAANPRLANFFSTFPLSLFSVIVERDQPKVRGAEPTSVPQVRPGLAIKTIIRKY